MQYNYILTQGLYNNHVLINFTLGHTGPALGFSQFGTGLHGLLYNHAFNNYTTCDGIVIF